MRKMTLLLLLASSQMFLLAQTATDPIPMVNIPAGSFYMGGTGEGEDFDEKPIHKVILTSSFRMSATEITNAQYEAFDPSHKALRGKNGFSKEDDEAVVYINYHEAMAFCKWLSEKEGKNYRLPTEAEWEYACHAGNYFPFHTGDGLPAIFHKNQQTARNLKEVSLKVGQTPPNAFGLYDMMPCIISPGSVRTPRLCPAAAGGRAPPQGGTPPYSPALPWDCREDSR